MSQSELKLLLFVLQLYLILQLVSKRTVCCNFHIALAQRLFCTRFSVVVSVQPQRGGWGVGGGGGGTAATVQSVIQYLSAGSLVWCISQVQHSMVYLFQLVAG